MGMKGTAKEASDTFVEFEAPDKDKILHGSGDQAVVRVVLYDNKALRTSGVTADSIIQLKGTTQPFPLLWVLGGAFGLVVVALLIVVIVRSGGKKGGGGAPPPPVVAGGAPPYGGYGGPPQGGGYGGPPQGGGYGGPPQGGGYGGPPQGGGYGGPPQGGGYGGGGGYGASPPVGGPPPGHGASPPEVSPPSPAAPAGGGVSPEFLYGGGSPQYGVTNDAPAQQPAAPPNPYASTGPSVSRATLQGSAGVFTVVPGIEMKAGRDGSQCGILLTEPRVSGLHASVKLDNGQLLIRDENSNNGTLVNGNRIAPGTWTPVQDGSLLRFGPVEFSVRLE
ncbi:MAG: FHA domain-containing protein [Polyangiaceae bacterium]|nr:FHA domain-containing protein [Polyangiaceae bacterium]